MKVVCLLNANFRTYFQNVPVNKKISFKNSKMQVITQNRGEWDNSEIEGDNLVLWLFWYHDNGINLDLKKKKKKKKKE